MRQLETTSASTIYKDTTETEKFCRMFNQLFDCFNTRHLIEAVQKVNSDLMPYKSKDDDRLKVCTSVL